MNILRRILRLFMRTLKKMREEFQKEVVVEEASGKTIVEVPSQRPSRKEAFKNWFRRNRRLVEVDPCHNFPRYQACPECGAGARLHHKNLAMDTATYICRCGMVNVVKPRRVN
jgi:hypothetical protein